VGDGIGESVRVSECQSVRVSKCQGVKVSECQSVRVSKCQSVKLRKNPRGKEFLRGFYLVISKLRT